jgi:hypothetical protein
VARCCECGDEHSVSGAAELVFTDSGFPIILDRNLSVSDIKIVAYNKLWG